MLKKLKKKVYEANLELVERGLVLYTWGNVSGIDREKGLFVIKPSGVPYKKMTADDMVVIDMEGNIVEGDWRPSSDTQTHLVLYKSFPSIGGVTHTHSSWATSWAQAQRCIPCLGTTHADYFFGKIPCTRNLTYKEITSDYEKNTGDVIVETFKNLNPAQTPGVLVANHGPYTWGKSPKESVYHAAVLEEVAKTSNRTLVLNHNVNPIDHALLDKHFLRKHGPLAYYGQDEEE